MLNAPEPACLVIADMTGYTSDLAGVELDHAQDIPADLMDTVVGSLHVTMRMERPRSARNRAFLEEMRPTLGPMFQAGVDALTPLLEAEMARRAELAASSPEAEPPISAGRHTARGVDPAAAHSS